MVDWAVDKGNIMNTNTSGRELALLLTQDNGGTKISSTRYIHYGTVTARSKRLFPSPIEIETQPHPVPVKTGRWGGVVTAFITMSSVKDEIDWEWPGSQTTQAQTNYFWQGFIRAYPPAAPRGRIVHTLSQPPRQTVPPMGISLTPSAITTITP